MSVSHRYKDFGGKKKEPKDDLAFENQAALEEQKLQSFEAGYQAGWDDAAKSQAEDKARISAEFSQNLQDMSFTYHEAFAKLASAFEPVLAEIIDKALPEICRETIGLHVIEQISSILEDSLECAVEIVVAPSNEAKISEISKAALTAPFKIICDNSLCDEQVFVRIGNEEKQIDLSALVDGVRDSAAAFFHEVKEQKKDG